MKKFIALLLAAVLCLGLCACGEEQIGAFTVLGELGHKEFCTIYRSGDKVSTVVEAALQVMAANGSMGNISHSWLGSNIISLEGNSDALARIEEMPPSRTLIVGVDTDAPPYAYYSGGKLVGMSVDLASALGSLLGWAVQVLPVKSSEIETQLASGNIDCALGFSPGCADPEKYSIGSSYMSVAIVLAVPEGSDVSSLRSIADRRVGTIDDPALTSVLDADDRLSKYSSGVTVYLTPPRCISALENGWCVAIAMDELMLRAYAASYVPQAPVQTAPVIQ